MTRPAIRPAKSAPRPSLKLVPPAKTWADYLAEGREFVLRMRPDIAGQEVRIAELARGWAVINAPIGVFATNRWAS